MSFSLYSFALGGLVALALEIVFLVLYLVGRHFIGRKGKL